MNRTTYAPHLMALGFAGLLQCCVPSSYRIGAEGPGSWSASAWNIDDEVRGIAVGDFDGDGREELVVATPDRVLLVGREGSRVIWVYQGGSVVRLSAVERPGERRKDLLIGTFAHDELVVSIFGLGSGGLFRRAGPEASDIHFWAGEGLVSLESPRDRQRIVRRWSYDSSTAGTALSAGQELATVANREFGEAAFLPIGRALDGIFGIDWDGSILRFTADGGIWHGSDELSLGLRPWAVESENGDPLVSASLVHWFRPPVVGVDLGHDGTLEFFSCRTVGNELRVFERARVLKGGGLVVISVDETGTPHAIGATSGALGQACAGVDVLEGEIALMAVIERPRGGFRSAQSRVTGWVLGADGVLNPVEDLVSHVLDGVGPIPSQGDVPSDGAE